MLNLWLVWTAIRHTARCVSRPNLSLTNLIGIQIVHWSPDYHIPSIDTCNALEEGFPLTVSVPDHTFPHSWHHEYGLGLSSTLCIAATYASLSFAPMF